MIKIALLFLISLPAIADQPTAKELAYLEMVNYRLNMIAISNDMADSLGEIVRELRLIRCKIEPIENDCRDTGVNHIREDK